MGKASSNKKVARIAGTSGGRTARGRTPWLWYGGLAVIVLLGVFGVVSSRGKLNTTVEHPNFQDHWHMAYAVYVCGEFKQPMAQPPTLIGIHTHTDGLIHIEPSSENDTGKFATVGRWESGQPGFHIDATSIENPGEKKLKNGDKCGDKRATLQTRVWKNKDDNSPESVSGDPSKIRIKDQELVTFAFVPEGTTIPKPPSEGNLANPSAMEGQTPPSTPETAPTAPTTAPATATSTQQ
jgi:hypothetical protein